MSSPASHPRQGGRPPPVVSAPDPEATSVMPLRVERIARGVVIAERFRLEHLLKQGGMGSVWVATHLSLDAKIAIKFMTAGASVTAEANARFRREARAAAQIRSSNVVKVLDHGVDDGLPYLVMELLEGEDLGTRLRRVRRLSLAETARVLVPIARGLTLAHEAGLVHRDLKPENIFLAREGEHEVPKILDFGVAKALYPTDEAAGDSTREGTLLGTPYFMSPEQARGWSSVDHRSDLWSLGVIVYRAIVGARPFDAKAIGDVIVQICTEQPALPSRIAPDLGPEVDAFFERALCKDAGHRFQGATELARAFCALVPREQLGVETAFDPTPHSGASGPYGSRPIQPAAPPLSAMTAPLAYVATPTPMPAPGTPQPSYGPTPHPSFGPSAPAAPAWASPASQSGAHGRPLAASIPAGTPTPGTLGLGAQAIAFAQPKRGATPHTGMLAVLAMGLVLAAGVFTFVAWRHFRGSTSTEPVAATTAAPQAAPPAVSAEASSEPTPPASAAAEPAPAPPAAASASADKPETPATTASPALPSASAEPAKPRAGAPVRATSPPKKRRELGY